MLQTLSRWYAAGQFLRLAVRTEAPIEAPESQIDLDGPDDAFNRRRHDQYDSDLSPQRFARATMGSTTSGIRMAVRRCSAAAIMACTFSGAYAGGIDHKVALDESGIWNRNVQLALEYSVIATTVGGALWLGNDNELGHTFWQAGDAAAISAVAAQGMKYAFGRQRPNAGQGPNQWFSGGQSFPSGEVTLQASFVTPFIVNYGRRYPWVWALEALPLYDSIARVKSQAHWQTDVLAGWALGTAVGYLSTTWQTPLFVQILPHGLTIGFAKRF